MIRFVDQKPILAACLTGTAIAELLLPSTAHSAPRQCIPIAYVLTKSDQRFKPGDLLCVGDAISLRNTQPLTVLCFATGKIVDLGNGRIGSTGCGIAEEAAPQACGRNLTLCVRPRGSSTARLKLIEPYSSNLIQLRPRFSWQSVPGATSYRVRVLGNVAWSTSTTRSQLSYPVNQSPLKPGSAYRVIVSAYRGDQILLSGEQTINVLPQSKISEIQQAIAAVQQLKLDPDEATIFGLDSIYQANGLIDESIQALFVRVQAGSRSIRIYQLLSKRYRMLGLTDIANQIDQWAQQLTLMTDEGQANSMKPSIQRRNN